MQSGVVYVTVCLCQPDPNVLSMAANAYRAIVCRTLLANRAGAFFSSSVGTCGGRNCKTGTNGPKKVTVKMLLEGIAKVVRLVYIVNIKHNNG